MAKYTIPRPKIERVDPADEAAYDKIWRDWLYYAQYELSNKDLKDNTLAWYRRTGKDRALITGLDAMPDWEFAPIGKYCAGLLKSKGNLPVKYAGFSRLVDELDAKVDEYAKKSEASSMDEEAKRLRQEAIFNKICERVSNAIDEVLESFVHNPKAINPDYDFAALISHFGVKDKHCDVISASFDVDVRSIRALTEMDSIPPEYGHQNMTFWRKYYKTLQNVQSALAAVRNSTVRRSIDTKAAAKALKYKRSEDALGVKSVDAQKVLGAKELWVYDLKANKLGVYYAEDNNGFIIKGQNIVGFNKESRQKRANRKAFEKSGVLGKEISDVRKAYKDITTLDARLNGKITLQTLLLHVA